MTKRYAIIKKESFPIVKIVFTGNKPTDQNFSRYLEEMKDLYSENKKLAIIFDATNAVLPGLKFQKMQAKWLQENEKMMKTFCVGTAYVITNGLARGVLKTIFKFQKQPVPYLVCDSIAKAETWVNQKIA